MKFLVRVSSCRERGVDIFLQLAKVLLEDWRFNPDRPQGDDFYDSFPRANLFSGRFFDFYNRSGDRRRNVVVGCEW